ncbi:MAG: hypothetical protein KJ607_15005 [Bacteroidetes bacterium]|nr:hypothetical protein [Bacteroidota bacterium]
MEKPKTSSSLGRVMEKVITGLLLTLALIVFYFVISSFSPVSISSMNRLPFPGNMERINGKPDSTAKSIRIVSTEVFDRKDGVEKDVRVIMENGNIKELSVDGKTIPESEYGEYDYLVRKALKSKNGTFIVADEEVDIDELQQDLDRMSFELEELKDVDFDEVRREIEMAMSEIHAIDFGEIAREVEEATRVLNDISIPDIQREIDAAMQGIHAIDFDGIMRNVNRAVDFGIDQAIDKVKGIDTEQILEDVNESLKDATDSPGRKSDKELEEILEELEKDE